MVSVLDVANHAKMSTATVSRALSGSPLVTAETKARALASAQALGYHPNNFARCLRQGRGTSVALVTGDIEHGIYPALARHVQRELEALGLDLLLFNLDHQEERLRHVLERAVPLGLRGLLLASADYADMDALLPYFRTAAERGVSILAVSQRLDGYGIPSIVHDDRGGAMTAIGHLQSRGRRFVAFLGRITTSAVGSERYQGYVQAFEDAGRAVDPALVWDVTDGYRFDAGYSLTKTMLAQGIGFDAVVTASDELAVGAMAAIRDHGLRVPDDVAIVGFGGIEWGRFVRPALSTIALDVAAMAACVRQSLQRLEGGDVTDLLTLIRPNLVVRDSS